MRHLYVIDCDLSMDTIIPSNDCIIGRLLRLSVLHCPNMAKAWSQLATWSYRWGRRVLDKTECVLTQADKEEMEMFIPPDVNKDKVYAMLSRTRPQTDEEDIEVSLLSVGFYLLCGRRFRILYSPKNVIVFENTDTKLYNQFSNNYLSVADFCNALNSLYRIFFFLFKYSLYRGQCPLKG